MAREGRRFEFGWLEVLGLILTFALGSALCFFLGIFVGKGLQESQIARDDHTVKLPIGAGGQAAPAAPAVASAGGTVAPAGSTGAPGAAKGAIDAKPAGQPGKPGTEAKPASQVAKATGEAVGAAASAALAVRPPVPTVTSAEATPGAPVPTPTPAAVAAVVARPTRTPLPAKTPAPARTPVPIRSPKPTRTPRATPTPAFRMGANAKSGWSIQVNAAKDETTANSVMRKLQERGFNAYVVKVTLQGDTWYRVRVGRFPTMEAATAAVARLKSDESYSRAFLVND